MARLPAHCPRTERRVNPLVGQRLVTLQGAHVRADQGLDAVAHPLGHVAERDAGAAPGGGGGVPAVVDSQLGAAACFLGSVQRPGPVGRPRAQAGAGPEEAEEKVVAAEVVVVDPGPEDVDERAPGRSSAPLVRRSRRQPR